MKRIGRMEMQLGAKWIHRTVCRREKGHCGHGEGKETDNHSGKPTGKR